MSFDYINEAFKRLDALNEDIFDTSLSGINGLSNFMNEDDASDIVKVIDPSAETYDELSDSYIGKVIINCNVCHSHIFENKEDVVIDEDGVVNPDMQCPYCGEMSGFTVVGEIKPFEHNTSDEEETADNSADSLDNNKNTEEETTLEESLNEDSSRSEIDILKDFLRSKGHSCSSSTAVTYLWSVIDLFDAGNQELSQDNLEDWYRETCRNYPEDLELFDESIDSDDRRNSVNELLDVNLDAQNFGGNGNNVSVLGLGAGKLGEATEDSQDLEEILDLNVDARGFGGTGNDVSVLGEGIFDRFKKKKEETPKQAEKEQEKEEPKKEKEEFTTYSYSEWIQALESGHKYYAEDGPEAGRIKLYNKAIDISACKNLAKDVVACMDAWMKHKGSGNFPHKSYAKHLEEGLFRSVRKRKNESIDELSLTANGTHIEVDEDENGKVTLTAEPTETSEGGTEISEVSDETMQEIEANNDIDTSEDDEPVEDESEVDMDIDEVDEEGLDELGEAYLKNIYENVDSFKTTKVSSTDSRMFVEGVIKFKSGIKKNTGFVFEAHSASKNGHVKFVGMNEHFSSKRNAFSLTGKVINNKLLPESLAYNYRAGARKIRGRVNKK